MDVVSEIPAANPFELRLDALFMSDTRLSLSLIVEG